MSRALLKFVRVSPTKARLIAREVQGMNAELALAALEFMPNKAAGIISKVIASAVANGEYEPEEVIITSCRVDKAAFMKRWRPRARGTANRILKPTAHILVEVATAGKAQKAKATPTKAEKVVTEAQGAISSAKQVETESKKGTVANETTATSKKAESKGDDLTKIVGIGKAYQAKLNSEGIFTYEEVANMSEEQIQMMEEKYSFKGGFKESVADAQNFVNGKDA
jgi:large subunit ribosomal protein L22